MKTSPFSFAAIILAVLSLPGDCRPLSSSKDEDPALRGAFSDARCLVKKREDERRRNRDAVLSAWINAAPPGEERFVVRCLGRPCPQDEEERILDRLAEHFERMPAFLRDSGLKQASWNQLPPGSRPDPRTQDRFWNLDSGPRICGEK